MHRNSIKAQSCACGPCVSQDAVLPFMCSGRHAVLPRVPPMLNQACSQLIQACDAPAALNFSPAAEPMCAVPRSAP